MVLYSSQGIYEKSLTSLVEHSFKADTLSDIFLPSNKRARYITESSPINDIEKLNIHENSNVFSQHGSDSDDQKIARLASSNVKLREELDNSVKCLEEEQKYVSCLKKSPACEEGGHLSLH